MLETFEYNRAAAVNYAHEWAFTRNPRYADFENYGGDCTNFISQCVYAGSLQMNYTPVHGWYYLDLSNRTPSWSGVEFFYKFMTKNSGEGPFARRAQISEIMPGDVVQLRFEPGRFGHSLLVVSVTSPDESGIRIATHTFDSDNRPLNTYQFQEARFIHFEGMRKYV